MAEELGKETAETPMGFFEAQDFLATHTVTDIYRLFRHAQGLIDTIWHDCALNRKRIDKLKQRVAELEELCQKS